MGRGVEKARVAFAPAENVADRMEPQAGPAQACSTFGSVRRGVYGHRWRRRGGMAKRSGLRVSHASFDEGSPEWISLSRRCRLRAVHGRRRGRRT
jgi:hypothetical protein